MRNLFLTPSLVNLSVVLRGLAGGVSRLALAAFLIPGVAGAATLTFDDISTGAFGIGPITNPYGGLNLSCGGVSACDAVNTVTYSFNPSGYQSAASSGTNVLSTAYDAGPDSLSFAPSGGGTFVFNSVQLTGAWRDGLSIAVEGFNGITSVDSAMFVLGNAGSRMLATFNWSNLTSVTITASGGTPGHFTLPTPYELAVDDLTYGASPVPLPAAGWLLLSGLLGIGARARRAA